MPWESLIPHIFTLLGGGAIATFARYLVDRKRTNLDGEKQDSELARQLRDELRKEIEDLRERVDHLEEELDNERNLRVKAELEEARAQLVIERYRAEVVRLRNKLNLPVDDIGGVFSSSDE